ncbi:hypothetical protein ACIGGE_00165 [Qipengyuania sp. NPDC077410]|jgi:hypothetical protein|uniref:hypothetical protein n=1 Tax=Qipengyuania sp. NPDC077410 TaxID=3364496 RepID=UPI0037C8B280
MAESLRRYTNVLSLLDMLKSEKLTLLPPTRWFDQNDALGLKAYSDLRGKGSVYALCFAEGYEQAHHWQIFASGTHGVAIQFAKEKLVVDLERAKTYDEVVHGPVEYRNLKQIRELGNIPLGDLPFLKRDTFKAEQEYRIVAWSDEFFALDTYRIPISLSSIDRIVLGPGMPDTLAQSLREIATALPGCSDLRFTKSRLVNNKSWAEVINSGVEYLYDEHR